MSGLPASFITPPYATDGDRDGDGGQGDRLGPGDRLGTCSSTFQHLYPAEDDRDGQGGQGDQGNGRRGRHASAPSNAKAVKAAKVQAVQAVPLLRKARLLQEFNAAGEQWPEGTSVHCYWCCHGFDGPPLAIPFKYVNDRFHVTGCFCSLECAAAYNFQDGGASMDERWRRYSLINLLASRLEEGLATGEEDGEACFVKQAPDRLALTMFGGFLDIDAFRAYCRSAHQSRLTMVNFPPMLAATQQVEEVNDGDVRCTRPAFIPLDKDRLVLAQERQRLQRKEPLPAKDRKRAATWGMTEAPPL